jgi:hypothetical protein
MESTFLGISMPKVLQQLKHMLMRKGFMVQTMPTANPVLVAYQKGGWFRKPKQLVVEIVPVNKEVTRIDITAIIENSRHAEELFELDFASAIMSVFKKVTTKRHGN